MTASHEAGYASVTVLTVRVPAGAARLIRNRAQGIGMEHAAGSAGHYPMKPRLAVVKFPMLAKTKLGSGTPSHVARVEPY